MDLQKTWNRLEHDKLNKPVLGIISVSKKSKHPVQKLIDLFKITLAFTLAFEMGFIYLLIIMTQPIVKVFLVIMIVVYLFFFFLNLKILKKIQLTFRLDLNLKTTLIQVYDNTQSTLAFQRKSSIFIYPLAATAGFLMGLAAEKDAALMMQKWEVQIILLIAIAVLTPSCYYLARWMEKVSYGKYLNQLQSLIEDFERIEK